MRDNPASKMINSLPLFVVGTQLPGPRTASCKVCLRMQIRNSFAARRFAPFALSCRSASSSNTTARRPCLRMQLCICLCSTASVPSTTFPSTLSPDAALRSIRPTAVFMTPFATHRLLRGHDGGHPVRACYFSRCTHELAAAVKGLLLVSLGSV